MQEYSTDAIVLDKELNGDLDARITLFTKQFGKLIGKAKSVRKITSKLSGHLEPGNLIRARLIEKSGLQIVDALKKERLSVDLPDFYFLGRLLADAQPEPELWDALTAGNFSRREALKLLGWDPEHASCAACGQKTAAFHVKSQEFFCSACALKLRKEEILYI
jgi:recombinational DNA repair protein (RecF pathway)